MTPSRGQSPFSPGGRRTGDPQDSVLPLPCRPPPPPPRQPAIPVPPDPAAGPMPQAEGGCRKARASSFLLPWLVLVLSVPACGSPEDAPDRLFPTPQEERSCKDLSLGDPRTGGTFHCVACSRHWRWEVRAPTTALFVVLELDCGSATDAHLSVLAPGGIPVWQKPMRAGERGSICVPHRPADEGTYVLQLSGEGPEALTCFSGSVWFSVYDQHGKQIEPATEEQP
jgi:hypothetical protein